MPAAAQAGPGTPVAETPRDDASAVQMAQDAWSRGGWTEVRDILEPVADDTERLGDERLRERALCLLADATVNDPGLDEQERRQQAASYLERLLDADPSWRMPPAIYSPELFELFADVQDQRSRALGAQCEADRNACEADMAEVTDQLAQLRRDYAALDKQFQDQEVEVRRGISRSRVFAAIPGGVGHFYNGDPAIGGAFLGAEAALGITGLTLILYRTIADGCRREEGFQRGSLVCASQDIDGIVRRRKVEEAVAWVFVGSIALDILIAQLRFQPYTLESTERVPRRELDSAGSSTSPRRRKRKPRPRAKVRPTGGGGPNGINLGISVRF
ncbi:MAG: hypothetical protein AB1Z98_04125 [Nannocystaceae bacterium]